MKTNNFVENFTTAGFVFSGIFTLIGVFALFYFLPDIGNSCVLDNYDGVDHYYDGNSAFLGSFMFLIFSAVIFFIFCRKIAK